MACAAPIAPATFSKGSRRRPASESNAPASASAPAIAAPMPPPAPVTSACRPERARDAVISRSLHDRLRGGGPGEVGLVLHLGHAILPGPGNIGEADLGGLVQRPGRIGEVRARHGA